MSLLHRIVLLSLCAGAAAAQDSASLVAPAARGADSLLTAAELRGYSGVALVLKDGAPILRRAYGVAQRESKARFTPSTVVQIGSNTKDFTLVALLQLMERGRLTLDDTLARFFPGAPVDKRGITVRQLMRHRSGLPIGIARDSVLVTRDQMIARAMAVQLQFKPGTGEQYSNLGFSLLAAIVEQLSGKSYDEYLRDNILEPLGLHDTGYLLPRFDPVRLAHGYSASGDRGSVLDLPHLTDGPSWTLRGNGGMLSTVADMATFYSALLHSERLLPAAARNRFFDPNGAMVLAGSDLTSYFVYQHEPAARLDMFLVSTTVEARAPQLLRQIAPMLGVREEAPDDAGAANAPEVRLSDSNAGATVRAYLDVFNGADSTAGMRFFTNRMAPSPDGSGPAARYARMLDMRANLGKLTPIGYREPGPGSAELRVRASNGDVANLSFEIETDAPYRIRSMRVRVGG